MRFRMDINTVKNKEITVGWIGTGVMGFWMCRHLMENGYKAVVFNRTKSKTDKLIEEGAEWADSPAAVAEKADVIFTIVGYPEDVRKVYFDDDGILSSVKKGSVLVDMTTTEPSLAVEIYKKAKNAGVASVDAPVSGGDVGAKNRTLTVMAGGDEKIFDILYPLFEIMGKNIRYQGNAGTGQHTKMCNQITISGIMIGVCESLLYAHKAGLNLQTMLDTIRGGAAACWSLDNLAPRILKGDFEPGFMVEHFIKDMGIALDEAKNMGLFLPGLSLVHQLYVSLKAIGYGKSGTHSLILALDTLSGSSFNIVEHKAKCGVECSE
jgi:3-hydroxyisobutyrate dehydrogenase